MNNEIQKHLEKMKNDLMSLKYVTGVDYDLIGYADGINAPIIIVDYNIPEDIEIRRWFNKKSKLKRDVIKTIENNGVIVEKEEFEDNDTYFYIVSYKTNWGLKKESLKDDWKPESDLYIRQINEIKNNLNISEYEIRKEGDSIKFRYNGKVYFAEPVAMYQVDIFDDNHNQIGWGVMTNKIKEEVFTDYIANNDFIYELVGGECTGIYTYEELKKLPVFTDTTSGDYSDRRNNGEFTRRKELDNQPELKGYLGPMWNGTKDGKGVIRYETQDVYDRLSESKKLQEDEIIYRPEESYKEEQKSKKIEAKDYSTFTSTNKVLSGDKGLSEKAIMEMRWSLPKNFKNMTDEQKQIWEELALRGMVMSCLIYGEDIHTSIDRVSPNKYHGRPFVDEYYDKLGKDVTEEIIKQQTDYFKRGKVIHNTRN